MSAGGDEPAASRTAETAAEARARAEARRAAQREIRQQQISEAFAGGPPGRGVVISSWAATALLVVLSVLALVDRDALGVYFSVTFIMFCLGGLLLGVDVVLAIARSTRDAMGIGGLFFLADSAPRNVQWALNGSLAAAVVVSVTTAVVGLSTPELAFGTLVPLLQLSLTGLWGVRHGYFTERQDISGAT